MGLGIRLQRMWRMRRWVAGCALLALFVAIWSVARIGLQVAGVALLGFGVTLLVMVLAYNHDVAMIASTPEAVWQFICGAPLEGAMVLPLLNGMSILTLLIGGAVLLLGRRRS